MRNFRPALVLVLASCLASAQDGGWPTYMHDAQRSGVTDEELALPLFEAWSQKPCGTPRPAWPAPATGSFWQGLDALQPRVTFDRAFAPVAVGDAVWLGSSSEDGIACLEAATGERRWFFRAQAPVRFAPTIAGDRLVFASDDGFVYGLDRHDGTLLWERRLAPAPTMIPGNGRLVSAWPVRTGPAVEDGIAYATAGLFPAQGTWGFALDVADGTVRWKATLPGDLSPQGYLLLSPTRLFVPNGRAMPFSFARADGAERARYGGPGGAWALVVDDALVTGPSDGGALAMLGAESRETLASFAGRRMVARGDVAYLQTDTQLSAVNRRALVEAPREREGLRESQAELTHALETTTDEAGRRDLARQLTKLADRLAAIEQELRDAILWTTATRHPHSLVLAGSTLFAGGNDEVGAYSAVTGALLWTGAVRGRALELAVAEGRLVVSTDAGDLHAFGAKELVEDRPENRVAVVLDNGGGPRRGLTDYSITRRIFEHCRRLRWFDTGNWPGSSLVPDERSTARGGYAVVLDGVDGSLAGDLSRSQLETVVVARSRAEADRLRASMKWIGDHRRSEAVRVLVWDGETLPFPVGFANLVVSERSIMEGTPSPYAAEMVRIAAPDGGTVVFRSLPEGDVIAELAERFPGELRFAGPLPEEAAWVDETAPPRRPLHVAIRGPRPGAGRWSHAYADAANTSCSGDRLVGGELALQWFGGPGPSAMVDRHLRTTPPLAADGILFVPGRDRVLALDANNGAHLWGKDVPGFTRTGAPYDGGHWAVGEGVLFVAANDACFLFDATTGEMIRAYAAAGGEEEITHWGWLALVQDTLLGSAQKHTAARRDQSRPEVVDQYAEGRAHVVSERVFAIDFARDGFAWIHDAGVVLNTSLTATPERVFLLRTTNAVAVADEDGRVELAAFLGGTCELVALDRKTGAVQWSIPFPEDRFRHSIYFACDRGVLTAVGSFNEGGRNVYALLAFDAATGALLWTAQHDNNRAGAGGDHGEQVHHPVLANGMVIAEPRAYDLRTGAPADPLRTGSPFFLPSRGGCGTIAGSENGLFYRDANPTCLPLLPGGERRPLTKVSRPGCWISILPAGGLVLLPEASAGCVCAFPLQTSLALRPR